MMSDLKELLRQRKELDEKIKQLRGIPVYKRCKVGRETYPTRKPDRFFVAVKYQPLDNGRPRYQTIFSSRDRDEVVNEIPKIIEELQGLYDIAKNAVDGELDF